MKKKLTANEENTLDELYRYLAVVINFFIEDAANKPASKVRMDSFASHFKLAIDSAYKRSDLNGLKMVAKDMKEMMTGCKESEIKALNEKLHQAGITTWTLV